MSKRYNHYLGKAGHLYMMSELLFRGWNVAIPEVDVGDDIFVVKDDSGQLQRVQVKTTIAKQIANGFTGQFNLSIRQLLNITPVPIQYAFIFRFNNKWVDPIIVNQLTLKDYYDKKEIGIQSRSNLVLHISIKNSKALCNGQDFSIFINNYTDFPIIYH